MKAPRWRSAGRLTVVRNVLAIGLTMLVAVACGAKIDAGDEDPRVSAGADAGDADSDAGSADASYAAMTCQQTSCENRECIFQAPKDQCPRLDCGGELLCEGRGELGARRCVLEALRAGKPGRLEWGTSTSYLHNFSITATIEDGRVASGSWSESYDSPSRVGSFTRLPLKPASFFASCLERYDLDGGASDEVQNCLRYAFEQCP